MNYKRSSVFVMMAVSAVAVMLVDGCSESSPGTTMVDSGTQDVGIMSNGDGGADATSGGDSAVNDEGTVDTAPDQAPTAQSSLSRTGLFISDIHFNPFWDPGIAAEVVDAPASQWDAIFSRSTQTVFAQHSHDTNFPLLKSALATMQQKVPNPDVIFVSGDMLVHTFQTLYNQSAKSPSPAGYQVFVNTTEQYLAMELSAAFPAAQILPTLGDWDTDGGTTASYASSGFLASFASSWSSAVNRYGGAPDFQTTFSSGGYYATSFPIDPQARLIGVYTQPWAAECTVGCAPDVSSLGSSEIQWLTAQLADARSHQQHVWLLGHVPPGIDANSTVANQSAGSTCSASIVPFWADIYSGPLYSLFSEYSDVLTFGVFAHEHFDDLRLFRDASGNPIFGMKLPPSITPLHTNPAFVQFAYDPKAGTITDTTTWYLTNLTSSTTADSAIWSQEYAFDASYGQTAFDSSGIASAIVKIQSLPAAQASYMSYYPTMFSAGVPSGISPFSAYQCALNNLGVADYTQCYCSP